MSNKSGFGRIAILPLLDPCLSPQAKALLVVYAAYSDMDWSREVTLGRATIEKILGVPEIWLKRHKKELTDAGYVTSARKRKSADLFAGTCAHVTLLPWSDAIAQRMEAIEAKHPIYVSAAMESGSLIAAGAGTGMVFQNVIQGQTCEWRTILVYAYLCCKSYGGKELPDAEIVSRDVRMGIDKVRKSMEELTKYGVIRRAGKKCYLTQDLHGMPVESDPIGNDPIGSDPIGSDPIGSDPIGSDPIGNDPIGSDPIGSDPIGNDPIGNDPIIYNNNTLVIKSLFSNSLFSRSHLSIPPEGWTEAAICREIDDEGMIPRSWARDPPLLQKALELLTTRNVLDCRTDYLEPFCAGLAHMLSCSGWKAPGGEVVPAVQIWEAVKCSLHRVEGVLVSELFPEVQRRMENIEDDPYHERVGNAYAYIQPVIWTELTKGEKS